jgi:hypothetical protein
MYKKLMAEKLISAINFSLKKLKIRNDLTVEDVLTNSTSMKKLLQTDDMKLFLRNIRSSPVYWERKKKDLFAMIRQLGCPTFFVTLSPAEVDWPELIVILVEVLQKKIISIEEAKLMDREEKLDLLRRDPVTTARYFENRIRFLLNFTFNKVSGPFADNPVEDYYWRIEFQSRGSPHIHMLLWCKGRHEYNKTDPLNPNNNNCLTLIDKYTTCETKTILNDTIQSDDDTKLQELIKYQRHRHNKNCQVIENKLQEQVPDNEAQDSSDDSQRLKNKINNQKTTCKYGFPWPILDNTIILLPLKNTTDDEQDILRTAKLNYAKIKNRLDLIAQEQERCIKIRKCVPKAITQNQFLQHLNFTLEEYMTAIRSNIMQAKVFLKRTSAEIMINPYNKNIIVRHRANMDIQYVLDSHAIVAYVTSYMMKSNAIMSRLLNIACEEIRKGNDTIQKKL